MQINRFTPPPTGQIPPTNNSPKKGIGKSLQAFVQWIKNIPTNIGQALNRSVTQEKPNKTTQLGLKALKIQAKNVENIKNFGILLNLDLRQAAGTDQRKLGEAQSLEDAFTQFLENPESEKNKTHLQDMMNQLENLGTAQQYYRSEILSLIKQ